MRLKLWTYQLFVVLLVSLWVACGANTPTEEATPMPVTPTSPSPTPSPEADFRVIAYVTGAIVPEVIPYEKLTHINYAFLIPNADGTFAPFSNGWKLKTIVTQAHEADVQVLISVGGWGWDEQFETMAADPALRAVFVQNLQAFVEEYGLDGADIDWEYPDPGPSAQNFLALIGELRQALPDKLLTTAVVSYGDTAEGVLSETFDLFDFVNVMAYDGSDHATMAQFMTGLTYWQERGLAADKIVMGVPFYARPGETIYRKLVETNPEAAQIDTTEVNGTLVVYNGIPTVRAKTEIALEQAGGIMFWTLEHDATGELSLLQAIDEVVNSR